MDNSKNYKVLVNFFHNTTLNLKFILILTLRESSKKIYYSDAIIIINCNLKMKL